MFSFIIKEENIKIRKKFAPKIKIVKDKTIYNRKIKHKKGF